MELCRMGAPRVLANTLGMERADWLRMRKRGIGGSDAAGILGLSPYASPLSVWADKVSDAIPDEVENEFMWLGNVLEDHVARRYAEQTGLNIVRCNRMFQHPEHDFMLANIDRRVKGKKIGIEIKTTSQMSKTDFAGGDINPWYYAQCQHYLGVTGWDRWILVVLVIGKGMYDFTIDRNEDDIRALIGAEYSFWNDYVVPHRMPTADGSESSAAALMLAYPQGNGEMVTMDCDADMREYVELGEEADRLKRRQEIVKQRIQERMGSCEVGVTANYTATWKNVAGKKTFDSKRFAAEQPDIYRQYVKIGAPSRRFAVKETRGA